MKPFAIFLAFLLFVLAISCDRLNLEKKEVSQKPLFMCIFFDLSDSTEMLRKTYFRAFKHIISHLSHGDTIVVGKITASSITEAEILKESFPQFVALDPAGRPTDNTLLVRKATVEADEKLEQKKKELLRLVEQFLFTEKTLKTDILSSLHVAERGFKNHKSYNLILVLFSDMAEYAAYNFYKENFTDERIEEIIKIEKAKGRLPDLESVTAFIVACSTEGTERFFALRNFWLRYFKECKANLPQKNYGSDYTLVQIR